MNSNSFRIAVVVSASLFAAPALAAEPSTVVQSDWPTIEQPRPARVLAAQPSGTPSAVSSDPTWPAMPSTMPAIAYPARTDTSSVFQPPVEAHVQAMAAARNTARPAAPAQLAAK